jgi:hypothetical protein
MSSQNEGRISLALQAYNSNQVLSLRAAASTYDVPLTTLRERRTGILPRAIAPANSRKFTLEEEQIILQQVLQRSTEGLPLQRIAVEEIANTMLRTKNPSHPQKVGKNWVSNFVKRNPRLSSIYNRKMDYQRAECEDTKLISLWFKLVGDTVAKYGVAEEDIYNFDETGFQMGVISTSKVITTSDRKGRPRTIQPGNREWVTSIEAINAKGWCVPPFIIFAAKTHQAKWYQTGLPGTWKIAVSDNGWTNDTLGLQWIEHFHQNTRHSYSQWRLLIFDGHGSHHTAQFKDFCLQNKILTLCMPAHTSHILQPLDVSCFGPLKKAYGSQIENKLRLGINHINKEEFIPAFVIAHQQAMTTRNIISGFKATGLVPFDPDQVLSQLGPVVEATPSPRSSQSSWDPKTPKTLPEVKKQAQLVLTEGRKRRRSSASSGEKPFQQLLKGFEAVVHEKALLTVEVAALRAENHHQKQKRARKKATIQQGGSLTVQQGLELVQRAMVVEQSHQTSNNIDPALLAEQPRPARRKAPPRCSKCGSFEHNARVCSS